MGRRLVGTEVRTRVSLDPGLADEIERYLHTVIDPLVAPHQVEIRLHPLEDVNSTLYRFHIYTDPEPTRMLIGKRGNTASALRTMARVYALSHGSRANVDLRVMSDSMD